MDESRFAILFQKYLSKTATSSERTVFFQLVSTPGADRLLRKYGELFDIPEAQWGKLDDDSANRILDNILQEAREMDTRPGPAEAASGSLAAPAGSTEQTRGAKHTKGDADYYEAAQPPLSNPANPVEPAVSDEPAISAKTISLRWWRWTAAAAAVILLILGGYYYKQFSFSAPKAITALGNQVLKDAQPGHNGAILTLAGGRTYLLDTMANGQIASGIIKAREELQVKAAQVTEATLMTPLGRQQQLLLSDGTKVWLNAGSSIRFPTKFTGNVRSVAITGEVYFEVIHNGKFPFEVHAGSQVIHDLGTHFNVNAYDNEEGMKVTLQEGLVQIGDKILLNPGEAYSNGKVSKVNAEGAIAWVSGYFHFERSDLQSVMRQLARWYNVEVVYKGQIPALKFGGDIQKSLPLSAVLELLAGTGIHYTLNGNELTIRP